MSGPGCIVWEMWDTTSSEPAQHEAIGVLITWWGPAGPEEVPRNLEVWRVSPWPPVKMDYRRTTAYGEVAATTRPQRITEAHDIWDAFKRVHPAVPGTEALAFQKPSAQELHLIQGLTL